MHIALLHGGSTWLPRWSHSLYRSSNGDSLDAAVRPYLGTNGIGQVRPVSIDSANNQISTQENQYSWE